MTESISGQPAAALSTMSGGWTVWPGQVVDFAASVQQVRADLDAVFRQVDQLTAPEYRPQLGSSPVGQALAAKFVDRLSGGQSLLSHLNSVLAELDRFVSQAEQTAARYTEADQAAAHGLRAS